MSKAIGLLQVQERLEKAAGAVTALGGLVADQQGEKMDQGVGYAFEILGAELLSAAGELKSFPQ